MAKTGRMSDFVRTFLLCFLCLQRPCWGTFVCPYSSTDGASMVTVFVSGGFSLSSVQVNGPRNYPLPGGWWDWTGITCDGSKVALVSKWELAFFTQGEESSRALLPLALVGRVQGGWWHCPT